MANLTFRTIKASGSTAVKGNFYFENINLSNFVDLPALLVIMTRNVDFENNFITINAAKTEVWHKSYTEATTQGYFVARILSNPSSTWIPQLHRIDAGKLKATGNILGIHTREQAGGVYHGDLGPATTHDEILITRLFLAYFGSE